MVCHGLSWFVMVCHMLPSKSDSYSKQPRYDKALTHRESNGDLSPKATGAPRHVVGQSANVNSTYGNI
jgi:hypothetical protein